MNELLPMATRYAPTMMKYGKVQAQFGYYCVEAVSIFRTRVQRCGVLVGIHAKLIDLAYEHPNVFPLVQRTSLMMSSH